MIMHTSLHALIAFALGLATMLVHPETVRAQADGDARALFVQGDAAYAEGRYETALTLFQEAYALSERPALLYNLANVLERLGRTQEAIDHLRRFEEHAAEAQREIIHRRMQALESRLAVEREAAAKRELEASLARDWDTPAPRAAPSLLVPWGGILSSSAALLLLGGGIALGAGGRSMDVRAFGSCAAAGNGAVCPATVASDLSSAQAFALSADIAFGIAGALAITSIMLFVIKLSSPAAPSASTPEQSAP